MTENIRGFVQALYGFDAVVQRMTDSDWVRQSPCEAWVARDVVAHVAWTCELVARMAEGEPASVPVSADQPGGLSLSDDGHHLDPTVLALYAVIDGQIRADPHVQWNRSRSVCLEALDQPGVSGCVTRSPWGETDMDRWLGFATWDPLVHTWDLSRAAGQPVLVDPALCERALEQARDFDAVHNLRRPGVVGPVLEATRQDALSRLLAFAGRNLDWEPS